MFITFFIYVICARVYLSYYAIVKCGFQKQTYSQKIVLQELLLLFYDWGISLVADIFTGELQNFNLASKHTNFSFVVRRYILKVNQFLRDPSIQGW